MKLTVLSLLFFVSVLFLKAQNKVNDLDGNTYSTIQIGKQIWMQHNLKSSKLNNETPIPLLINENDWQETKNFAMTYYNGDEEKYGKLHGALYNFHAVSSGKLCPTGWHVPTIAEWDTLFSFLSKNGHLFEGLHLALSKSLAANTLWNTIDRKGAPGCNLSSNNSSGFNGLPSGYRTSYATYNGSTHHACWWTSDKAKEGSAHTMGILFYEQEIIRIDSDFKTGLSVRCIKD